MAESYCDRGMTGEATFSLYIRPTPSVRGSSRSVSSA